MRFRPSLSASEPESSRPVVIDSPEEQAGERAPVRRGRAAAGHVTPGATELYFRSLAGSQPLTREGEVAIGRRMEAGALACVEAWVRSPIALRELAWTAEDVHVGALSIRDLLCESDATDVDAEACLKRLAGLLELARSLHAGERTGEDHEIALAGLAAGLAELRLDPAFEERIERSLRTAAAEATGAERAPIQATIAAIARARRAVAQAKSELVQANLRLAVAIAREHQRFGVPLLDLVQEGNLGLIRAADKFEYRRGHRFGTYAAWWIKQAIKRAVLNQGKAVRMPVHLTGIRSQVVRARRDLVQERGREPSVEEVAERSGLSVEKVRMIGELALDPLSLDAPIGEEGDTRYGDLLAGDEPTPADMLARRRLIEQTRELLDSLQPRERELLRRRFGLDGNEDETLEEIGQSFSLTRERIRQIEAKLLEKLRMRSRQRELGSYLEG
ncbi:sigma-70 family RNA polymerase sigma factor [Sorangium cellulosum]|uniref:RNA polymerase sigma factor n=1 Tax=Sorangium cellulosum TaxID=56 RepID=A0A150QSG4_SORCE|nr:sigma-70 family RNA polymerase sigma factor [Sorangium cellulosum]KYF70955.1 RNA polymerase subunit sigma [Sorangium cellulosum]